MRSPISPVPAVVRKWVRRARYLRWLDALGAWLVAWVLLALALDRLPTVAGALAAGGLIALVAAIGPLRWRWRPVSGTVGFLVSRALRPGDRAWYVRAARADLVLVTARRGLRMSIAAPELGAAEAVSVRRTRVLVVPADTAA